MNNTRIKIKEGKSGNFQLSRLFEFRFSEKRRINSEYVSLKLLDLNNKKKKDFKDKFKYGILSLKIADRDKSLY